MVIDLYSGFIFSSAQEAAFNKKLNYSTFVSKLNGSLKNNTGCIYIEVNNERWATKNSTTTNGAAGAASMLGSQESQAAD